MDGDDGDFTLNLSSVISNVFNKEKSECADDRRKLGVNRCCLEEDENEEGEKVIILDKEDKENLFTPLKKRDERAFSATPLSVRKPFSDAIINSPKENTPKQGSITKSEEKSTSKNVKSPEKKSESMNKVQLDSHIEAPSVETPGKSSPDNYLDEMPIYSARKGKRFSIIESPDSVHDDEIVEEDDDNVFAEQNQMEEEAAEESLGAPVDTETASSFEKIVATYNSNEGLQMIQQGLAQLKEGGYNPVEVLLDMIKVGAEHAPLPEDLLQSEHLTEDVLVHILSVSIEHLHVIVNKHTSHEGETTSCDVRETNEEDACSRDDDSESVEELVEEHCVAEEHQTAEEDLASEQAVESGTCADSGSAEAVCTCSPGDNSNECFEAGEVVTLAEESDTNDCHEIEDEEVETQLYVDHQEVLSSEEASIENPCDEVNVPNNFLNNVTVRSRSRRASTYFDIESDSDMDIGDSPDREAYQLPVWAESAANNMAANDVDDVEIKDSTSPCDSVFVDSQARDRKVKSEAMVPSPVIVCSPDSNGSGRPSDDFHSAASQTLSSPSTSNGRLEADDASEVSSKGIPETVDLPLTKLATPSDVEGDDDHSCKAESLSDSDMDMTSSPGSPDSISGGVSPSPSAREQSRKEENIDHAEIDHICKTPECECLTVASDMSCSSVEESCITMSTCKKPKRTQLLLESDSEDDIFECDEHSPGKECEEELSNGLLEFNGDASDRSYLEMKKFQKEKESLSKQLFVEFNEKIFENKLPSDLQVKWNKTLNTTAGITKYSRRKGLDGTIEYSASIELSSKVIDCKSRLRQTFCHELCHAAAWLINHVARPPHGKVFKYWADRSMTAYPDLNVSTCHTYDIHYKYRWKCTNDWCGRVYGRHSNSINTSRQACGICSGKLEFLGKYNADGTPAKARAPSQFSLFVKENYNSVKRECGGADHATVMKHLSEKWNVRKQGELSKPSPAVQKGVKSLIERFETTNLS